MFLNKHATEEYAGDLDWPLVSAFLRSKQLGDAKFAMLPLFRNTGGWLRSAEMVGRRGERDMDVSIAMDHLLLGTGQWGGAALYLELSSGAGWRWLPEGIESSTRGLW